MRITIPKRMFGKPIEGDLEKYLSEQSASPSVAPQVPPNHTLPSRFEGAIDMTPWLGGDEKTQNQWIEYANANNLKMISASDLYRAPTRFGSSANKNQKDLIDSLRKDFKGMHWLVSGTQIHYDPASLEGQIIHYAGSTIINPIKTSKILIPDYSGGTSLTDVLGSSDGLKYLQTLFHTSDSKEEIVKNLEALSNKKSSKTYIWTPDQSSRAGTPVRAVRFCCNGGGFRISGDPVGNYGRSRGVQ